MEWLETGLALQIESKCSHTYLYAPLSIHSAPATPDRPETIIYFEVENVDLEVRRLKNLGIVFDTEPADQDWLWREAYLVDPAGPSCHTGAETCFFRRLDGDGALVEASDDSAAPTLLRLERTLQQRKASDAGKSYTKSLLEAGPTKIDAKLREEAAELDDPPPSVAHAPGPARSVRIIV